MKHSTERGRHEGLSAQAGIGHVWSAVRWGPFGACARRMLPPVAFFHQEGAVMKGFLTTIGIVGVIAACAVVSLSFSAQAAEKKKISGTGKILQVISKTTLYLGDVPHHELSQEVRKQIYTPTEKPPDWDVAEEVVAYEQSDSVAGSGSHRWYGINRLKSGDERYEKGEGTHTTTVKAGGAWETTFEGKFEWIGGTGKYKNIKGGGTYKGKATAEATSFDWEMEVEY
jgi:hypothetical protein